MCRYSGSSIHDVVRGGVLASDLVDASGNAYGTDTLEITEPNDTDSSQGQKYTLSKGNYASVTIDGYYQEVTDSNTNKETIVANKGASSLYVLKSYYESANSSSLKIGSLNVKAARPDYLENNEAAQVRYYDVTADSLTSVAGNTYVELNDSQIGSILAEEYTKISGKNTVITGGDVTLNEGSSLQLNNLKYIGTHYGYPPYKTTVEDEELDYNASTINTLTATGGTFTSTAGTVGITTLNASAGSEISIASDIAKCKEGTYSSLGETTLDNSTLTAGNVAVGTSDSHATVTSKNGSSASISIGENSYIGTLGIEGNSSFIANLDKSTVKGNPTLSATVLSSDTGYAGYKLSTSDVNLGTSDKSLSIDTVSAKATDTKETESTASIQLGTTTADRTAKALITTLHNVTLEKNRYLLAKNTIVDGKSDVTVGAGATYDANDTTRDTNIGTLDVQTDSEAVGTFKVTGNQAVNIDTITTGDGFVGTPTQKVGASISIEADSTKSYDWSTIGDVTLGKYATLDAKGAVISGSGTNKATVNIKDGAKAEVATNVGTDKVSNIDTLTVGSGASFTAGNYVNVSSVESSGTVKLTGDATTDGGALIGNVTLHAGGNLQVANAELGTSKDGSNPATGKVDIIVEAGSKFIIDKLNNTPEVGTLKIGVQYGKVTTFSLPETAIFKSIDKIVTGSAYHSSTKAVTLDLTGTETLGSLSLGDRTKLTANAKTISTTDYPGIVLYPYANLDLKAMGYDSTTEPSIVSESEISVPQLSSQTNAKFNASYYDRVSVGKMDVYGNDDTTISNTNSLSIENLKVKENKSATFVANEGIKTATIGSITLNLYGYDLSKPNPSNRATVTLAGTGTGEELSTITGSVYAGPNSDLTATNFALTGSNSKVDILDGSTFTLDGCGSTSEILQLQVEGNNSGHGTFNFLDGTLNVTDLSFNDEYVPGSTVTIGSATDTTKSAAVNVKDAITTGETVTGGIISLYNASTLNADGASVNFYTLDINGTSTATVGKASEASTIDNVTIEEGAAYKISEGSTTVKTINQTATTPTGTVRVGTAADTTSSPAVEAKSATLTVTGSSSPNNDCNIATLEVVGGSAFNAEGVKVNIYTIDLDDTSTATVGKADETSQVDFITIEEGATFNVAEGTASVETINRGASSQTGTVHVGTAADTTSTPAVEAKAATLNVSGLVGEENNLNVGTLSVEAGSTFNAEGVSGNISKIQTAEGTKGTGDETNHAVVKVGSTSGNYSVIGDLDLGDYTEITLTRAKINSDEVSTLGKGVNLTLTGDKTADATINFAGGLNLEEDASFTATKYKTIALGDVGTETNPTAANTSITVTDIGEELTATSLNLGSTSSFTASGVQTEIGKIKTADGESGKHATISITDTTGDSSKITGDVELGKYTYFEGTNTVVDNANVTVGAGATFSTRRNTDSTNIGTLTVKTDYDEEKKSATAAGSFTVKAGNNNSILANVNIGEIITDRGTADKHATISIYDIGKPTTYVTASALPTSTIGNVELKDYAVLNAKATKFGDSDSAVSVTVRDNASAKIDNYYLALVTYDGAKGKYSYITDTSVSNISKLDIKSGGTFTSNANAKVAEIESSGTVAFNKTDANFSALIGDVTLHDGGTLTVDNAKLGKVDGTGSDEDKVNIILDGGSSFTVNTLNNTPAIGTLKIGVNKDKDKVGNLTLPDSATFKSIDKIVTGNGLKDDTHKYVALDVTNTETLGALVLGDYTELTANAKTVSTTDKDGIQLGSHVNLDLEAKGYDSSSPAKIVDGSSISTPKLELKKDSAEFSANYFKNVSLGNVSTNTDEGATGGKITISNTHSLTATSIALDGNSSFTATEGIGGIVIYTLDLDDTSTATLGLNIDNVRFYVNNITIEKGATFNAAQKVVEVMTINKGATEATGTVHVGTAADETTGTTAKSAELRVTDTSTSNVLNIGTLDVEGTSTFNAANVAGNISKIKTKNGASGSGNHAVVRVGSIAGSYSEIGNLDLGEYTKIYLTRAKVNSDDLSTLNKGVNLTLTGDKTDESTISFDSLTLEEDASFTATSYKTVALGNVGSETTPTAANTSIQLIDISERIQASSLNLGSSSSFDAEGVQAEIGKIKTADGESSESGKYATIFISDTTGDSSKITGDVELGKYTYFQGWNTVVDNANVTVGAGATFYAINNVNDTNIRTLTVKTDYDESKKSATAAGSFYFIVMDMEDNILGSINIGEIITDKGTADKHATISIYGEDDLCTFGASLPTSTIGGVELKDYAVLNAKATKFGDSDSAVSVTVRDNASATIDNYYLALGQYSDKGKYSNFTDTSVSNISKLDIKSGGTFTSNANAKVAEIESSGTVAFNKTDANFSALIGDVTLHDGGRLTVDNAKLGKVDGTGSDEDKVNITLDGGSSFTINNLQNTPEIGTLEIGVNEDKDKVGNLTLPDSATFKSIDKIVTGNGLKDDTHKYVALDVTNTETLGALVLGDYTELTANAKTVRTNDEQGIQLGSHVNLDLKAKGYDSSSPATIVDGSSISTPKLALSEDSAAFTANYYDSVSLGEVSVETEADATNPAGVIVEVSNTNSLKATSVSLDNKSSFTAKTGVAKFAIDSITTTNGTAAKHAVIDLADSDTDEKTFSRVGAIDLGDYTELKVDKAYIADENGNAVAVSLKKGASVNLTNATAASKITELNLSTASNSGEVTAFNAENSAVNVSKIVTSRLEADQGGAKIKFGTSNAVSDVGTMNLCKGTTIDLTRVNHVSADENGDVIGEDVSVNLTGDETDETAVNLKQVVLNGNGANFSADKYKNVTLGDVVAADGVTGTYVTVSNAEKLTAADLDLGSSNFTADSNVKQIVINSIATDEEGTEREHAVISIKDSDNDANTPSVIGDIDLGSYSELTAENINVAPTTAETVDVKLGENAKFTLNGANSSANVANLEVAKAGVFTATDSTDILATTIKAKDVTSKEDAATLALSNVTNVQSTDLWLGDYAKFTSEDSANLHIGTVHAGSGEADSTGKNATAEITGAEEVMIGSLNLGSATTFKAEGKIVDVNEVLAGEEATLTITGATDQYSRLGKVNLGKNATLNATNVALYSEAGEAVDVTLGETSKFTMDSNGRASKIGTLNTGIDSEFSLKNATVEVETATGSGNIAVGSTVGGTSGCTRGYMYVKTLSMNGGSIYVDPAYGETSVLTVESLGTGNNLNTNITAGPGALVTFGMGSAAAAKAAVDSNIENKAPLNANAESTGSAVGSSSSLIYVAQAMTLGTTGSLTADPTVTVATGAAQSVNAKNGGVIVIDQQKVGVETVVFSGAKSITVDDASDGTATSALAVINIVDGTTKIPLTDVTDPTVLGNNFPVYTDNPYVTATLERDTGIIWLTLQATDDGMTVLASMGAQAMANRIDTVLSKTVSDRFALPRDITKGKNLWAYVSGERFEQDHIGAGASFAANMGYGTFGLDVYPTENSLLGAAFQYSHGTLKGDVHNVKNKLKAYSGALYAGYTFEATGIELLGELAYTQGRNDVSSSYYEGLKQKFDTKTYSAGLTVQKKFDVGAFDITPSVGVRVSKIKTDEIKAGLIKADKQSQTLVAVPVAVRFTAKPIETESGWLVSPKFKLSVTPTFGDKKIEAFGSKCTVIDTNPVQGSFGIGFTKGNFSTDIEANFGTGRQGTTSLGGKIGVNYRF